MKNNSCSGGKFCVCAKCVDELYEECAKRVIASGIPNISFIQRQFKIGYNRAVRLMESLEAEGIVSAHDFKGTRSVLVKEQPHD